jgi:hypothetical protein
MIRPQSSARVQKFVKSTRKISFLLRGMAALRGDFSALSRELSFSNAQKPVLQTKLAASSVLPLPWYLATSGYWHNGRRRVTAPV